MALNDMVYEVNGTANSAFLSIIQGTVTFVAGQTASADFPVSSGNSGLQVVPDYRVHAALTWRF